MPEKTNIPYSCTKEYDRKACKEAGCVCCLCYKQEFCGHCDTCRSDLTRRKTHCHRFEGTFTY